MNASELGEHDGWYVVTVKRITAHEPGMYKLDDAKFDVLVTVEQVVKEAQYENWHGLKEGEATFVFDDLTMIAAKGINNLAGKRFCWGLTWWRIRAGFYHIDQISNPFGSDPFSTEDIEQLKTKAGLIDRLKKD